MYKVFIFVIIALVVAVISEKKNDNEEYTSQYDGIDIPKLLANRRLVLGYCKCLLSKGACSPDGAELKRVLPEALEADCRKCSKKHKHGARLVLHHLIDHEPKCWKELEGKFDPEGTYAKKYKHNFTLED
uniref:Chemosensory protein CSP2 n=1 Tax=Holotrichia oblita TaxID=644536 RepID=G9BWQ6_HOLOL|nr:chemosensory protein CSP2 [Holotrichia oblita]